MARAVVKIQPGAYVPLMGGEYIRAFILFFWALWLGVFGAGGGATQFFNEITPHQWVWGGVFLAVASFSLCAAFFHMFRMRFVAQALIAVTWGWIAGGFASQDWTSGAITVTVGLSIYSIYGMIWVPLVGVYRSYRI